METEGVKRMGIDGGNRNKAREKGSENRGSKEKGSGSRGSEENGNRGNEEGTGKKEGMGIEGERRGGE